MAHNFLKKLAIFLIFILSFDFVRAHVCDDVLEFDPIEIRSEFESIKVKERGQFKVFLKNNYGASIHNVKIIIPENIFEINVTPTLIEKVRPGEKVDFLIKITIPENVKPGEYPLILKVWAQEFEVSREVNLKIQVERPIPEPEAVVEIIPEDIPIAISVFPSPVEIESNKSAEFRVYVRNGHTKPIHNLKLFFKKNDFEVKVVPEIIEKIEPGGKNFFLVNLFVPAKTKRGDYTLAMELGADELAVRRGIGTIIRVKKVREEITYIYLVVISLIILLLVWRWQALKRLKQLPRQ